MRYTNGPPTLFEDAVLRLTSGKGLGDPVFGGGEIFPNRIWNGIIHYEVASEPLPPPPPPNVEPPSGDGPSTSNQFEFGRVARNVKKGIARLAVEVPGPGRIVLQKTKRLRRSTARTQLDEGELFRLLVRPRGKAKRKLAQAGKSKQRVRVRVRAKVTYRPTGGEPRTKIKKLRLVRVG